MLKFQTVSENRQKLYRLLFDLYGILIMHYTLAITHCGLFRLSLTIVRRSGRGTVHWRPHKIFLHFHQLWTLLNKIREGVALSPLRIFL